MAGGELVTLAEAAGQAVVTVAATDAWGTVKAGVARLLGRGDQGKTAVAGQRLEDTRHELAAAAPADLVAAQMRLAVAWSTRLADLLDDDPDAAAPLRTLL